MKQPEKLIVFLMLFINIYAGVRSESSSFEVRNLGPDDLIPFGVDQGDTLAPIEDDDSSPPIVLPVEFPFFNRTFSTIYVTTNGLISYGTPFSDYVPIPFPYDGFTGVAPYWTDIDIRNGGLISYRELDDRTGLISRIDNDIRRAFPAFANYRSSLAFVATYDRVAGYGISNSVRNTFQVIVCTNGRYSFTIYHYKLLEWHATEMTKGAQAGFNAGDNITYYVIDGSFTPNVLTLVDRTNVGVPGKWIFRIDLSDIEEGGCPDSGYVTVRPKSVFAFGGDHVSITGPCFRYNDVVELKFQHQSQASVPCKVADSTFVICKLPFLNSYGRLDFDLGINGSFSRFRGFVLSKELNHKITGLAMTYDEDDLPDEPVPITWSTEDLTDNIFLPYTQSTSFVLAHVYVDESNETRVQVLDDYIRTDKTWTYLDLRRLTRVLKSAETKSAAYEISMGQIAIGMKKILRLAGETYEMSVYFFSKAIEFTTYKLALKGSHSEKCDDWYNKQPTNEEISAIMDKLPPCWPLAPLTSSNQFPNQFSEFSIDKACNPNLEYIWNVTFIGSFVNCQHHAPHARACYRATLDDLPYRQQCCYDSNGVLLVGPPSGGTLDMSNELIDHIMMDVDPHDWCCKKGNAESCAKYYEKRPSDDGSRWVRPNPGGGSGDPHIVTLDDLRYSFNGYGEYVLLRISEINFEAQTRILPFRDAKGEQQSGTIFKGIAVRSRIATSFNSLIDSVQIEFDEFDNLNLFINGESVEMSTLSSDEPILMISLLLYIYPTEIVIKHIRGVSISVGLNKEQKALSLLTVVSNAFRGKTRGLLGVMDGNSNNDLTLPDGSILSSNSNDREIYSGFGLHWATTAESSVFVYSNGLSHSSFVNTAYMPAFISDGIKFNNSELERESALKCNNNQQCIFDISVTGDLAMGNLVLEFEKQLNEIEKAIDTVDQAHKSHGSVVSANVAAVGISLIVLFVISFF